MTKTQSIKMKSLVKRLKKYKLLYLVLLVAMAYYFVMLYIPIFWGFELSFKEMKIGSTISGAPWVGLQNYKYVFSNPEIFKLLKNTLFISVCRLVFTTIPPILLTIAIFDLKNKAYQKFCQTMVYIPHFFSWVIIYGIVYAVTFPAMKPVITFSLIMALGNILNNDFEQILLFYNSAVYEVGDVIDTWVYRVGLGQMQYGVGSAVSMLKAVISLVLILSANKISKKATGRGMF